MYSKSSFLDDCIIPWKGSAPPNEIVRVVTRNAATIRADFGLEVLPVLSELAYDNPPTPTNIQTLISSEIDSSQHNRSLERRSEQVPPDCYGGQKQVRNRDNGDGFPHQNYFHVQQSVISTLTINYIIRY
jgi:hypothetical protein